MWRAKRVEQLPGCVAQQHFDPIIKVIKSPGDDLRQSGLFMTFNSIWRGRVGVSYGRPLYHSSMWFGNYTLGIIISPSLAGIYCPLPWKHHLI